MHGGLSECKTKPLLEEVLMSSDFSSGEVSADRAKRRRVLRSWLDLGDNKPPEPGEDSDSTVSLACSREDSRRDRTCSTVWQPSRLMNSPYGIPTNRAASVRSLSQSIEQRTIWPALLNPYGIDFSKYVKFFFSSMFGECSDNCSRKKGGNAEVLNVGKKVQRTNACLLCWRTKIRNGEAFRLMKCSMTLSL